MHAEQLTRSLGNEEGSSRGRAGVSWTVFPSIGLAAPASGLAVVATIAFGSFIALITPAPGIQQGCTERSQTG